MKLPRKRHAAFLSHATGFVLPMVLLVTAVNANPQSSTTPVPSQQSQQSAPSAAQPAPKDSPSKAATPLKPKKVLTNDDLDTHSNGGLSSGSRIVTGDSSSLLTCESVCEQQARAQVGYDSDREGEWQMQVANARRDLVADTEWRNLLSQTIQQTRTYCNFLEQQSRKTAPGNNSYNAQVQRARNQQYFENMDRTLQQGLESLANRSQNRIQEVQALSPVRAAMMTVQLSRIAERNCDLPR
jgi:hypothetical protein